jgi:hypothetical protein
VFDRIFRRRIVRAGRRDAAGMARRQLSAWLAILGLYVQLFAAGLCTSGTPFSIDAAFAQGAFPICHTGSGDPSAPAQDQAPGHHACPYCAIHCKAAMLLAPAIGAPESFAAVATQATPAPFAIPGHARFSLGAPPRGPPASA